MLVYTNQSGCQPTEPAWYAGEAAIYRPNFHLEAAAHGPQPGGPESEPPRVLC